MNRLHGLANSTLGRKLRVEVWVAVMVGLDAEAKKKAERKKCAYVGCFQT
jgi:hypothetical protein